MKRCVAGGSLGGVRRRRGSRAFGQESIRGAAALMNGLRRFDGRSRVWRSSIDKKQENWTG